jgi:D-alanyl-D-alanine dipeptidase
MGTGFDHMDETSARNYMGFKSDILENRKILENTFIQSAKQLNLPMLPLPSEWWDFRFPATYTEQFDPLHDKDLPPQMQMTHKIENNISNFDKNHFEKLADEILARIRD